MRATPAAAQADMSTGSAIFRVATPCLYLALLLQSFWVFLAGEQPRSTSMRAFVTVIIVALLVSALQRLRRPASALTAHASSHLSFTDKNIALFAELFAVVATVVLMALHGGTAIAALSWLVLLAALFPLVLNQRLSSATVFVLSGLAVWMTLRQEQGVSTALFWPALLQAFTVLAIGSLSCMLKRALHAKDEALQQAHHSRRHFEAIARTARHVFVITDAELRIRFANHVLQDLLGASTAEIEHQRLDVLLQSASSQEQQRKLRYLCDTPFSSVVLQHQLRHRNGNTVWLESRAYNLLHDEIIGGLMFSIEDVSARIEAESRLRDEHALLQAVLDHNPSMMYATDPAGNINLANLAFRKHFGLPSEVILRRGTIADLIDKYLPPNKRDMADNYLRQDRELLSTGKANEQEVSALWNSDTSKWFRINRYPLYDAQGRISGLLCIARDITERKQYRMQLEQQALHDPLTGLPNRRYLLQAAGEAINSAHRNATPLAVLFCDLDFFKSVNDTHGHDFGDKCLSELTRRFQEELPSSDFVARFGGNEFVVLTPVQAELARFKAERLLEAISKKMVVDDAMVKIQASIGIALLEPQHKLPSDLIRNADAALQQAKERGRNRVEMYDASLQTDTLKRGQMDVALRFALERNELVPTFQPKVSSLNGKVKGFELLLRWHSSQYGTISPADFIPIAETSGLVVPIGLWALEQACRQLKEWQDTYPDVTIAVNVSMRQLLQASFLYEVMGIIDRIGVRPGGIELELTETSVMANPILTIDTLTRLKQLGLRVSLDDFGTGYSSLAYLQRLPINLIKIDKAFIRGLGHNPGDMEIVRLILALAQTLNLETVAEGVETREQMMELKKMGCYMLQGFVFSEALSAEEADELLRSGRQFVVA